MSKPKVSIVTAVYNGERFLAETIKSILNQTFNNFEFIIINDSSKDSSLKIIKNYMKKDKRIILVNNHKNIGSVLSRNIGLKKARGKYIAILDHDDISLPDRLYIEYDFLEKNKDIFLVGSGAININENGKHLSKFNPITNLNKIKEKLSNNNCFYHPSIMYRNKRGLFYREKLPYADDYDFYLRLLSENKKLANISKILILYRKHQFASSRSNFTKMELFAQKAREFYFQRLKYGKDEYNKFNPNEILNLNIEKTKNKRVLELEIKASFKINNFKRTKKFCRKYFKNYGIFNKFFIYYLLSFTNKRFINFLKKIIFS